MSGVRMTWYQVTTAPVWPSGFKTALKTPTADDWKSRDDETLDTAKATHESMVAWCVREIEEEAK